MPVEKNLAEQLLSINAIKLQPETPFTWASGWLSPIYCDNRITLGYPEVRNAIKMGLASLASSSFDGIDRVAGVATAGIAHGALLADYLDLPFCYVRSKAKAHGRQNLIEGEVKAGEKILVIEDLISTGGSSLQAVQAIRNEGAEVLGVLAIFSYDFTKAKENFENADCPFFTLTDYPKLLETALKMNYIDEAALTTLEAWRAAPHIWRK